MRLALMVRFLFGGLILQAAAAGFCYLFMEYKTDNHQVLLITGLLNIFLLLLTAFRFVIAAREYNLAAIKTLQEEHAKEREKIRVNAERQKVRLVNKNHKQMLKETRRANAAANCKIGTALAAFLGLGGVMLYSQLVTVGLFVLAVTGGGVAGYLVRTKQEEVARSRGKLDPGISAVSMTGVKKKLE